MESATTWPRSDVAPRSLRERSRSTVPAPSRSGDLALESGEALGARYFVPKNVTVMLSVLPQPVPFPVAMAVSVPPESVAVACR